jgi:HPr kinase/phosphorylase
VLALELLTDERGLGRLIEGPDISSPGLVLTGFTERFPADRMQVLGETEIAFLASLGRRARRRALELFFSFDLPSSSSPSRRSRPSRSCSWRPSAARRWSAPAQDSRVLPPDQTVPGGSLRSYDHDARLARRRVRCGPALRGQSGIGKSEAVLDLIERGHRLVADDMVIVSRRGNEILIGRGHELQRHHMEIRGVGIIDIAGSSASAPSGSRSGSR